jgi:hypothetical protein
MGPGDSGGVIYYVVHSAALRSCIYVRNNTNALLLLEFCSRDVTVVRMTYSRGRNKKEFAVTSAYLPYDSELPPTKKMRAVINH